MSKKRIIHKKMHRFLLEKTTDFVRSYLFDGCFIESGVKQGTSSVIMSKSLNKKGYLFDTWKNFPHFSKVDAFSEKRKQKLQKRVKSKYNTFDSCVSNLKTNEVDHLCKMIQGDICKTIPDFIKINKDIPICFIHSDSDLYEPTKVTLKSCWPSLLNGGIIFVHDYGSRKWPGINKSINNFVKKVQSRIYVFDPKLLHSIVIIKNENNEFDNIFANYIEYIEKTIEDNSLLWTK